MTVFEALPTNMKPGQNDTNAGVQVEKKTDFAVGNAAYDDAHSWALDIKGRELVYFNIRNTGAGTLFNDVRGTKFDYDNLDDLVAADFEDELVAEAPIGVAGAAASFDLINVNGGVYAGYTAILFRVKENSGPSTITGIFRTK